MQRALIKLPVPIVTGADPVNTILESPEFQIAREYFTNYPPTSLLHDGGIARAFIYLLICSMGLRSALEIGTFRAGTTEVITRAIWANGGGHVDTVDPSGYPVITAAMNEWAPELRALCTWHNENSMAFYHAMTYRQSRYDLVFVDGDHEHYAALFDIQRCATVLTRGGFLLIDNVEQPAVRLAALRFLREHQHWELLAPPEALTQNPIQPTANPVMSIQDTAFWLIRAPSRFPIDAQPTYMPLSRYNGLVVRGLQMRLAPGAEMPRQGAIHYRTSLQGIENFDKQLKGCELVSSATVGIEQMECDGESVTLRFAAPIDQLATHPRASEYEVLIETYMSFVGEGRLVLADLPRPF
jgi:predicted O-methyltransferase YrrM